jgi:geranylgeranyl pyrophosphate synthase
MPVRQQPQSGAYSTTNAGSSFELVRDDLARVETIIQDVRDVDSPKLREMLDLVLGAPGKRLRATVALLAGRFGSHHPAILSLLGAAIELLHTVSLLHDDVIDSAETRRGRLSANAKYHNAAAVVLGDYIFVAAADIIGNAAQLDRTNITVLRLLARAGKAIASGELAQDLRDEVSIDSIDDYLIRIERKTASLFSASAEAGAVVARAPERTRASLSEYGRNIGIAFQIVDDILDFSECPQRLGKPVAADLQDGLLTLPALLFIQQNGATNPVTTYLRNGRHPSDLAVAEKAIQRSGVISASYSIAREYRDAALAALALLPDIPARTALAQMAEYVVERTA